MQCIFPATQQIVSGIPEFFGEFVFTPEVMFFVAQAPLNREEPGDEVLSLSSSGLFGGALTDAVGSRGVEGSLEPNLHERGILTGSEPLDELCRKLEGVVSESRQPGSWRRRDLVRPQRLDREITTSVMWDQASSSLLVSTKYDELQFAFDVGHQSAPRDTARQLGWLTAIRA